MKKFNRFSKCAVQMIGVGVLALAVDLPAAHAQPQPFTLWQGGSSQWGAQGIYPAQPGQPGYPGARTAVQAARDAQGNLWMYGGTGYGNSSMTERLPDLWKFDAASSTWLWMGGMPDDKEASYPAAHGGEGRPGDRMDGAFWVDNDGNVWMFGGRGKGTEYGILNDLWKYHVATDKWTWEGGSADPNYFEALPANPGETGTPSARYRTISWTNGDGDLMIWGGFSNTISGAYTVNNEMWKYDVSAGEWIYLGTGGAGQFPAAPGGVGYPPMRIIAATAVDAQHNLWVVGGSGFGSGAGNLADVWKFDDLAREWYWMGGEQSADPMPVYPAAFGGAGSPGGRAGAALWADGAGSLWMFGGAQLRTGDEYGHCNDLWRFSPASNEWRWVSGSDAFDSLTQYPAAHGEVGYPGSRYEPLAITIKDGGLWMFGGYGYGATAPDLGHRNDLWGVSTAITLPHTAASDWQIWQ